MIRTDEGMGLMPPDPAPRWFELAVKLFCASVVVSAFAYLLHLIGAVK